MKTPYALFFFALLFFFASCGKDKTIIHGRVVDKDTGLGVKGALVLLDEFVPNSSGISSSHVFTDSLGYFNFSSEYKVGIFTVGKIGYFQKRPYNLSIKEGEENDVIIELLPPDCTLNLKIKHDNPHTSTLNFLIYNSSISKETSPPPSINYIYGRNPLNPLVLAVDSTYYISYPMRGGEYSYFHYDTLKQTATSSLRFKDSVFIAKGETKTFEFKY